MARSAAAARRTSPRPSTKTSKATKRPRALPASSKIKAQSPAAAKKTTTAKAPAKAAADAPATKIATRNSSSNPIRLSDDDLNQIWKTYKRTKDINLRDILLECHLPLVRMIAERLLQTLPKSIEIDDLTSAGVFGLLDAIDGFDLSRGIKFKTYCTTRIRGSILDELRSQDWVPRLVRLKAHRLEKALRALEGELGRNPNTFELAEAMGISIDELQATENEAHARAIYSLSEKWDDSDDDKDIEKLEILADKKGDDPVQSLHQRDVLELITRNLTKKERLIIIMYYYEGLTMREIGEIMELTESRVCQIHSNVMARLKAQLDRVQIQTN
jgi:RNA polymerase sigma factor for flagellar operon FliA